MDVNITLAHLKEWHQQLHALIPELGLTNAADLPKVKRETVRALVFELHRDIENLEEILSKELFDEGVVGKEANTTLLRYYRQHVAPEKADIAKLFEALDPGAFELFKLLDCPGDRITVSGDICRTFQAGLEKIDEIVQEFPELEDSFLVDDAWSVFTSNLIRFDPDKWVVNARALQPVLTVRSPSMLPVHIKVRLGEVYRSFIFDNSLAVIALARSALEYAILDNCQKWNIDPTHKVTVPKPAERFKPLDTLIEEVGMHLPHLISDMDFLRTQGNEIIHPKTKKESNERLLQRGEVARECVLKLTSVVEELYLLVAGASG